MKRALVVEDDILIAMFYQDILEGLGWEVSGIAATADDAVSHARSSKPDLVLMDVRLEGRKDGVDAAKAIHAEGLCDAIVFVTGSLEAQQRIATDHPRATLFKPVSRADLATVVAEL